MSEDPRATPVNWYAAHTLDSFAEAARRLRSAEAEYRAAQQAYGEAVKQLSEEATK